MVCLRYCASESQEEGRNIKPKERNMGRSPYQPWDHIDLLSAVCLADTKGALSNTLYSSSGCHIRSTADCCGKDIRQSAEKQYRSQDKGIRREKFKRTI